MTRTAKGAFLAGALALAGTIAAAKDIQLASSWPKAAVKTDGTADEWSDLLRPLSAPPLVVGVQNDADYLYVCVKTSDPKIKRELAVLGLTVWADGTGKKDRTFGVRYPAGGGPRRARPEGGDSGAERSGTPSAPDLARLGSAFEVIGPTTDDRLVVPRSEDHPVQSAVGDDSGVLVIELRLPLKPTDAHPLAVGAGPGKIIALGLEAERPKMEHRGGFQPGGGRHGGRGGRGFGGPEGEMSGSERPEMGKPFLVWLKVPLALPPAAPPAATGGGSSAS